MNHRERIKAILNYQSYDRMPIVHFGFWDQTLEKWAIEGHITQEEARGWADGNQVDMEIGWKLGFDFNWYRIYSWKNGLYPQFNRQILKEHPDGRREVLDENGAIIIEKPGVTSIPEEVGHTLVDRKSWEEHYLPRLQFSLDRIDIEGLKQLDDNREFPIAVWCGSLFGEIRNWTGVVGLSYLMSDDPLLVEEMIETVGFLAFQGVKTVLSTYDNFDFAHFWEDICFKSGPLVNPKFFYTKVGPQYKRIMDFVHEHGIYIASLDCDGKIDKLIPTWFENGINTMFPIEVGTWNANIAPWREQYGRELRGVGGMNKVVFAYDYKAIDQEIERLRKLVDLGGFIPCPDHRIPPDAKWENVQYYCDRMRKVFG